MDEEKDVDLDEQQLIMGICKTVSNNILATLADGAKALNQPIPKFIQIFYDFLPQIIANVVQMSIDNEPMEFLEDRRIKMNRGMISLIKRINENPEVLEEWMQQHAEMRVVKSNLILPETEIQTVN